MLEKIDAKKYEKVLKMARRFPNVDLSSLEATIAIMSVAKHLENVMECDLGRYNLSRGRFRILLELMQAEEGGLAPADLADRIEVSRGTMTGLVDTLEKDELVVRSATPDDRRTILIKITEKGTDFANKALPENFRRTNQLMQHLSLENKETLVELLAKVIAGLQEYKAL